MRNFVCKNIGFISIMNEMGTILKPQLPFLYSKLLEGCALFGCSHIFGNVELSLTEYNRILDLLLPVSSPVRDRNRNFEMIKH